MADKGLVVKEVKKIIGNYFRELDVIKSNLRYKVPLMSRLYDENEVAEVIDTLLTPGRLTLNASGELKIEKFEYLWANLIGIKNGVMVNSGSSANLVSMYVLTNPTIKNQLKPGDEVIIPAVNWSTSVTPLYAAGLKPVFVDVNLDDYCMDVSQIEAAISPKTKAIMVVHLLGFPVEMDSVMEIARRNNLYVIEDSCESPGAEWNGSKVGSFGDISTFSFYLSHHITTLEGGMVMTNNDDFAELARIIRSQGVMRNVKSPEYKNKINSKFPEIDPRFLFANTGFNFRPTEMEGAFGMVQFKRFDEYLKARILNAAFFTENLNKYSNFMNLPVLKKGSKCSWFFYPVLIKDSAPFSANEITSFLERKGIETRPIMSGDYTKHPVAKLYDHRIVGKLENTKLIHRNGFCIGVYAGIKDEERNYVISCFEEFLNKY